MDDKLVTGADMTQNQLYHPDAAPAWVIAQEGWYSRLIAWLAGSTPSSSVALSLFQMIQLA